VVNHPIAPLQTIVWRRRKSNNCLDLRDNSLLTDRRFRPIFQCIGLWTGFQKPANERRLELFSSAVCLWT
jgi:hypothetical protein